jgi:hypothetical protein
VDATSVQNGDANVLMMVLQGAVNPGEIWRARDGRAAYYAGADAGSVGQTVRFLTGGKVNVPKTTGISILDGGQVFWHWDNNLATFKRRLNSKDFYLGTAYGDCDTAASLMTVNLNVARRPHFYDLDLDRDPFTTAIIKTAGSPLLNHRGGAWDLLLDSANEAQKVDALGNDSLQAGARAIVEMGITIVNGGAAGAPDFNVGVASATHNTDADAIAQHLFLHVDGNSNKIWFQSKDGTNTTAATDSGATYTAGTRFEVWFDMRNPNSVAIYVEGVRVLSGTTFNVSAAAAGWKTLAHLEKTAAADVFEAYVDWLSARAADQSINGV